MRLRDLWGALRGLPGARGAGGANGTASAAARARRAGRPVFTAAITGDSMLPVLRDGDWVLVLRAWRVGAGDVVAARDPRAHDRLLVKRAAWRGPDGWWLLGDNPPASTDSRTFGPVPAPDVLGRVVLRYHPRIGRVR